MPDIDWSPIENGMPGFHLIINPQKPLPPEARIHRQFINHSLTLNDKELQSLLSGRDAGIATLNTSVGKLMPWLPPDTRLKFSTQIADALLDRSLSGNCRAKRPPRRICSSSKTKSLGKYFSKRLRTARCGLRRQRCRAGAAGRVFRHRLLLMGCSGRFVVDRQIDP